MKKHKSKQDAIYEGIENIILNYKNNYNIVPLDKTILKINKFEELMTREEPPTEKEVGEIIGIPAWCVTPVCSVCYSQTFDMIVFEDDGDDDDDSNFKICRDCLVKGLSILDDKGV
jgi:hypothetical protein